MKVRLLHFAVLREITGKSEEALTLEPGTTAGDVWQRLRTAHPRLTAMAHPPMTAINEDYAAPETPLRDGDELAFIPPVAGG